MPTVALRINVRASLRLISGTPIRMIRPGRRGRKKRRSQPTRGWISTTGPISTAAAHLPDAALPMQAIHVKSRGEYENPKQTAARRRRAGHDTSGRHGDCGGTQRLYQLAGKPYAGS